MIKTLMARRYRPDMEGILARIVAGGLVHVDETQVNLQKGKGYVWVLTNMEDVVYFYRPNREADFLHDLLRGFKGVLVSDFYPGYESLPCEQQTCLFHLIRDINDDLMGSPYDEEFKALAGSSASCSGPSSDTIDKYGLKRRHLHKHKAEVARFFRDLDRPRLPLRAGRELPEAVPQERGQALHLPGPRRSTLEQQHGEHAIKAFAWSREVSDGRAIAQQK